MELKIIEETYKPALLKICRVCMDTEGTVSLFSWEESIQRCAQLMKCAAVEVSEGDGLPESICSSCAAELAASYQFATRCETSDRALRSTLVKQEVKSDHDSAHGDQSTSYLDNDDCRSYIQATNSEELEFKYTPHNYDHISDELQVDLYGNNRTLIESTGLSQKYGHYKLKTNKVLKGKVRKGSIHCSVCNRLCVSHSALENHIRSHTKEKPFICDLCKKCYSTKHILKRHVMNHYGIRENKKPLKPTDRRRNRPKMDPLQCTVCGRMTSNNCSMDIHMRSHTGEKPFSCEVCGIKFKLKGTLTRHTHSSHPELCPDKRYVCEHCGKLFHARYKIILHLRQHTGEKPYKCPFCPMAFAKSMSRSRHKRIHTGEKPYSCTICERSFREQNSLKRHMYVHTTEKKFSCHICNKRFKSKNNLASHATIHTKGKATICNFCGITLSNKGNLKIHIERIHSEKSGTCVECKKHFGDLEAHMVTHTGDKPYKCKICDQAYATKRSLSHHMGLKHKNIGRFKCSADDCQKTFPMGHMLEFHMLKAHSRGTPSICAHCGRAFLRVSDLSRHLKLNHKYPNQTLPVA